MIKLLKKNDLIFFILKSFQSLFKKIINKIIIYSGLDERISKIETSLVYKLQPKIFPWQTLCLNGQENRKKIITKILTKIKFDLIVETGTEYGFSTKYFSQFSNKIMSIEKSKPIFFMAKNNLIGEKNIKLILNDSKNLNLILNNEDINPESESTVFFYLDAHAEDDYPLIEEISLILNKFKNFILVIDDFEIPGDDGYGYDSYRGRKLNIKFIKKLLSKKEYIFFPNVHSSNETGRLRGYVLITNNEDFKQTLNTIKEISIFDL